MSEHTIHFEDPWSMPYVDYVDIFVEALHRQIGPSHPLYQRQVYPMAVSRDLGAVLFETDDEPEVYAVVFMEWGPHVRARKRPVNPKTEVLRDRQAVAERIERDHSAWLAQFQRSSET